MTKICKVQLYAAYDSQFLLVKLTSLVGVYRVRRTCSAIFFNLKPFC